MGNVASQIRLVFLSLVMAAVLASPARAGEAIDIIKAFVAKPSADLLDEFTASARRLEMEEIVRAAAAGKLGTPQITYFDTVRGIAETAFTSGTFEQTIYVRASKAGGEWRISGWSSLILADTNRLMLESLEQSSDAEWSKVVSKFGLDPAPKRAQAIANMRHNFGPDGAFLKALEPQMPALRQLCLDALAIGENPPMVAVDPMDQASVDKALAISKDDGALLGVVAKAKEVGAPQIWSEPDAAAILLTTPVQKPTPSGAFDVSRTLLCAKGARPMSLDIRLGPASTVGIRTLDAGPPGSDIHFYFVRGRI